MPISLREVAARVGVSPGTVSHVLNGNTAARIAPATQERVRRVAEELGYRPNRMARSLGRRKTDTIGLLISGLRNPFFVGIMERAEELAIEAGYAVQIDSAPSAHGTYGGHHRLSGWPVDAAIMWTINDATVAAYMESQEANIPVVYIGAERKDDTDWVSFDYVAGGRRLTEHLISQGKRRISYVSPYPFGSIGYSDLRHNGYVDVCAQAGLEPMPLLVTDAEETRQAGFQAGQRIARMPLAERPDAIFCHNDMIAIGAYCSLTRAGIRVPEDIAVAGFDGVEDGQFLEKALTTIRLSPELLCETAFAILNRRLGGDRESPPEGVILPVELIPGSTS